ncbi:hypothetical protein C0989_004813 [Termitomyces sp. Mn162]|nr:hypothetical protein C0989_004813 [Termitomyces sp. Mn162]
MVLSDSGCGGAAIEELELEGFVEVVASEVELTANEGAGGATVNEGREYLGGGVSVKEFEGNQGGEALEGVGSERRQGLIDEVISGATVNSCGDGVVSEGKSGVEEEVGGGVGGEACWEVVQGKYCCAEKCGQGREDIGVWSAV